MKEYMELGWTANLCEWRGPSADIYLLSHLDISFEKLGIWNAAVLIKCLSFLAQISCKIGFFPVFSRPSPFVGCCGGAIPFIGMKVGTQACCGAPLPMNAKGRCGRNYIPAGSSTPVPYNECNEPNSYAYWDYAHPSQALYKVIADDSIKLLNYLKWSLISLSCLSY